ncbi:MAG: hypothetical protein GX100_07130 [candidate division WS1 bacterium]|jgi:uncharacterized membrane protein (Fun14 family)|nr:hypothetical protein [candidate division WS1 bacterium]
MIEHLLPGIGMLGMGGLLGVASAITFKSATRAVGCAIGLLFLLIQVLAYYKIVSVDWALVAQQAEPAKHVASAGLGKLWQILTYNLPLGGGFVAGFWLGWKRF